MVELLDREEIVDYSNEAGVSVVGEVDEYFVGFGAEEIDVLAYS
jgi:hypothetical protein